MNKDQATNKKRIDELLQSEGVMSNTVEDIDHAETLLTIAVAFANQYVLRLIDKEYAMKQLKKEAESLIVQEIEEAHKKGYIAGGIAELTTVRGRVEYIHADTVNDRIIELEKESK